MAAEAGPTTIGGTDEVILEAANRCFNRFGIRRTTVEDVAREAGVSRGSVYRYFRDKNDLVEQVMVRNSSRFFEDVAARMRSKGTFAAKLAEAAVMARSYRESDPIYAGLAATEPETLAVLLTTQATPLIEMAIEFLRPLIAEAKGTGELRADLDDDRAAEWCVRIITSLITTPSITIDLDDEDAVRTFVAEHIVRGLAG